jgi:hypothetical protein
MLASSGRPQRRTIPNPSREAACVPRYSIPRGNPVAKSASASTANGTVPAKPATVGPKLIRDGGLLDDDRTRGYRGSGRCINEAKRSKSS